MEHPDEGTIHAWLDGALGADEGQAIEGHLAECAACRAAVSEARGLIAGSTRILLALDSVPGGVLPAASAPNAAGETVTGRWAARWRSNGWRAAAAIVLVGSVSWLVTRSNAPADVTPMSPVNASVTTPGAGATGGMTTTSPPPSTVWVHAAPSTDARANIARINAKTPNATRPGVAARADQPSDVAAQKAVPLAAPARELARASTADAPEQQTRSAPATGGRVAVAAAAPNAPTARSSASPRVGMLQESVAPMGNAGASPAIASASPKSERLTGCYALETSPSSGPLRAEAVAGAVLPARVQLVGGGAGSGRERGTVLTPPLVAADGASRVRGEWTSLGANVLELRIGDGPRSVTATLSVVGDSVTGQAHADSGAVTDRPTAAVKGRRTSCGTP